MGERFGSLVASPEMENTAWISSTRVKAVKKTVKATRGVILKLTIVISFECEDFHSQRL